MSPAPSPFHQTVSRRLQQALMRALEELDIAYVFNAPCDVILEDTTVVQPDLAIVKQTRKNIITKRGIEGTPEIVIEILSPSTRGQDEFLKRSAYARQGIPEYWLVDPEYGWIEVLKLGTDGYTPYARFDRASTLSSPTFEQISISLASVFRPL